VASQSVLFYRFLIIAAVIEKMLIVFPSIPFTPNTHLVHKYQRRVQSISLCVRVFFSLIDCSLDLVIRTRVVRVYIVGQWLDGVDTHALRRRACSGGYDNARMFVVGDKHPLQPYITFLFFSTVSRLVHG